MLDVEVFSLIAGYWLFTREILLLAGLAVLITGLDDLVVDGLYIGRRIWRHITIYRRYRPATVDALATGTPEGGMAIFIPAWNEASVIGSMLRNTLRRWTYANYRIFVGVYPNDPDTTAVVAAMADPRVELVVVDRPGRTTKAHCLNNLWRAMEHHEHAFGRRFKAIVLHDAEDVVHSRELVVFDYLIPHRAMVQLPVAPIPDPRSRWIAGHYLDEFAESHTKEMVVREAIGAAMPSAGVACAFDRTMLGWIADDLGGAPFDPDSLTEDYELGHRIAARGGTAALVRIRSSIGNGHVRTREHFPATLEDALRQKTRWMLGIALHGWDRIGWQGGFAARYMLLRDRKALLNALIIVLAYMAALAFTGALIIRATLPAAAGLPPIVEPGSGLAMLLGATSLLLVWRLSMRVIFTARQHGWIEGVRALPRAFIANIINFLATLRAVRQYLIVLRTKAKPVWDKTEHQFPQSVPAE